VVPHVAVVSGSRADFGPLLPLLAGLRDDPRLRLSTVACAVGEEAEAERQVEAFARGGIALTERVVTPPSEHDLPDSGVTAQAARALDGVATALERIAPDMLVLLGDRFEIMATAVGAHLLRIPIVHLSGGDETLGSLDDAMRHAISRLANLHFPTSVEAGLRLRALGIPPDRIDVVGSTALDALVAFTPMSRTELAAELEADLDRPVIAVTYHPATQADEPPVATVQALLAGVREAAPEARIVITGSNADEGGAAIDAAVVELTRIDPHMTFVPSLGVERYWSLLHHADAVVGNSSSALIEAPVVGLPVVDVGERQTSRLRTESCIHAIADREAIAAAVREALTRPHRPEASPYGDGRAVPRILDRLAAIDDPRALLEPRPLPPVPA
jgi:UDP-hydrolysing UDP-N-acetyl-D-glucosamine 2-epimerase